MNTLTVLSFVAVAACASAQLLGYPGAYGAYPGILGAYSGLWNAANPLTLETVASAPLTIEAAAPTPLAYNVAPFAPASPVLSQYHSQDEFGRYSFGHAGGWDSRAETRDAFGVVRGSYNYLDTNGKVQTQHYVADARGFRVEGTNLPEAAAEAYLDYAEDVAAARAEHLAAHEAAAAPAAAPEPKYIDYTQEVAQARAAHETSHAEATAAAAAAAAAVAAEESTQ